MTSGDGSAGYRPDGPVDSIERQERYTVLIADDHRKSCEVLARLIKELGCDSILANNGAEALEVVNSGEGIDLVFLDILMPEQTGYDVLESIKAGGRNAHVPVIMITGVDSVDSAVRCIEMGAEDYLIKPFDPVLLKARVKVQLERKKLRDTELDYGRMIERRNVELKAAKEKAEAATKLKDKYISLVSHDLRAPLGAIQGMLEIVEDKSVTEEKRGLFLGRAIKNCRSLLNMIDRLLNATEFSEGKIVPVSGVIRASDMAETAIEKVKPLASDKNVRIDNEVPKDMRIHADRQLAEEVLLNLVSNAIKFSNEGGTVTVRAAANGTAAIAVEDEGVGVTDKARDHLFDHDVKTTTFGTDGERGTGLGLPISMDIMKAHGGSLSFESEPGRGSVFLMEFPSPETAD